MPWEAASRQVSSGPWQEERITGSSARDRLTALDSLEASILAIVDRDDTIKKGWLGHSSVEGVSTRT
jgi:hypothetical protein